MKKIAVLVLCLLLTACGSVQTWRYTSEPKSYEKPKIEKIIVVPPFRDIRQNENTQKYMALAWIPLVPYSQLVEANTPEGLPLALANFGTASETLAKTTAEELNNASIFKNVYFSFNTEESPLILEGTLKDFKLERYWTFYGLSLPGDLLWFLGFPAGKAYNTITIQYRLIDKKGREFFNKEYTQKEDWLQGFYYGNENYRLEKLMKKINMELVEDLSKLDKKLK